MSRKVFILALPILFSFIFIGFALSQDRGRGYGGFLERLKQELNLTPEQVTKIQKILDSGQKGNHSNPHKLSAVKSKIPAEYI